MLFRVNNKVVTNQYIIARGTDCLLWDSDRVYSWDGENMPNPHLQIHPVFIPMTSRVIIWDFRLRISDLWNRYALSIYNRQHSLNIQFAIFNLQFRLARDRGLREYLDLVKSGTFS